MTVYYVDSGATGGSNNGTSRANAWLSIGSVPALIASDRVYISHTHSESSSTATMPGDGGANTGVLPRIYSVDFSGRSDPTEPTEADLTPGATIGNSTGNLSFAASAWWYGVKFNAAADITWNVNQEIVVMYDCDLFVGEDDDWNLVASGGGYIQLINCTFGGTTNSSADNLGGIMTDTGEGFRVFMLGCDADASLAWKDEFLKVGSRPGSVVMLGCDWSNWGTSATTHTINGGTNEADITVIACKFQTGATMASGITTLFNPGSWRFVDCGINNNTDQEQGEHWDLYHLIETYGGGQTNRAVYRTGGFTPEHQTNPISLRVTEHSAGDADPSHPTRIPLAIYNTSTGSTQTYTVEYIAADATSVDALDYTEMWLEIMYYDDAGTLLRVEDNMETPIKASPTAHAAGTGTGNWTLTDAATNRSSYKLAMTSTGTIAQKGFVRVNVVIGDMGTNDELFIDPMVTIS